MFDDVPLPFLPPISQCKSIYSQNSHDKTALMIENWVLISLIITAHSPVYVNYFASVFVLLCRSVLFSSCPLWFIYLTHHTLPEAVRKREGKGDWEERRKSETNFTFSIALKSNIIHRCEIWSFCKFALDLTQKNHTIETKHSSQYAQSKQ